jgi:DNA-binding transcriptional regulator YhcF (GntR family)
MQSTNLKIKRPDAAPSVGANISNEKLRKQFVRQKLAWIDGIVLDLDVPSFAFRLAALIASKYLNSTSGDAWPKQTTLAADLGVCTKTVQNGLDALEAAGHLAVRGSRGRVNHYRPIFKTEDAQSDAHQPTQILSHVGPEGAQILSHDPRKFFRMSSEDSFVHEPLKENPLKEPKEREGTRSPIIGKKEKTGWPQGFKLTPSLIAYAAQKRFSHDRAEEMFEKFRNNSLANGKTFADWEFGWRSWVDKEINYKRDEPDRNRIDDRL